jgi:hypothetical protein
MTNSIDSNDEQEIEVIESISSMSALGFEAIELIWLPDSRAQLAGAVHDGGMSESNDSNCDFFVLQFKQVFH